MMAVFEPVSQTLPQSASHSDQGVKVQLDLLDFLAPAGRCCITTPSGPQNHFSLLTVLQKNSKLALYSE